MKITQTNVDNVGIDVNNAPDGYQHEDALIFDESHSSWIVHKDYELLSKDILTRYPNTKKILDIGSGAGNLKYTLKEHDSELIVVTLDGNKETINSPLIDVDTHFILRTDIDYNLIDENGEQIKFDVICSFEHFEHIPPETFNVFLNNIKKHSHDDTILIASVATWKYPTTNVHCNVLTLKQWDDKLTKEDGMTKINEPLLNPTNWHARFKSTSELHYKINGLK
jgi:cyclopropane fatty-acyl-phospholipid synthase-like methyltransferase